MPNDLTDRVEPGLTGLRRDKPHITLHCGSWGPRRSPETVARREYTYVYSVVRLALDRESVLAAGYEVACREGLEALGIRSVAATLGATPMALYRYVADASDLRNAVLELFLGSVPLDPASVEDLARWAHAFRAWLTVAPGLPRLVLLRWFELPRLLGTVESLLNVLAAVGLHDFDLVASANALFSYVLARGELEEAVRAPGVDRDLSWGGDDTVRPLLAALRDEYEVARLDAHFHFGLELLLVGIVDRPDEAA